MKSAHSAYSGPILIDITDGRNFLVELQGVLDSHVTVDFLTNESRFKENLKLHVTVKIGQILYI